MKRKSLFIVLLAFLSCASGYLMSKASWISRVGITFFYKEFNFLKIRWQGAMAVFLVLMVLFLIHHLLQQKLSAIAARALHILILFIAAACLYYTYDDYASNLSHRLVGWHFYYGLYVFWMGWILICLFFILERKRTVTIVTNSDKTETINQ